METWQKVWREGIAPQLSTRGLQSLRSALNRDDARLLQGRTVAPPRGQHDQAVHGTCAIGWCGWHGEGKATIPDLEQYFADVCFESGIALGDPSASRWFLNWFDGAPREEVRQQMLREVEQALTERADARAAA